MSSLFEVIYKPPPTIERMLNSDKFIRLIVGPFGSGKSVGCVMALPLAVGDQALAPDGRRYVRFAIVRNTNRMLMDTTWATFKTWLPPGVAGDWRVSTKTFTIDTPELYAEFIFRALDDDADVTNLMSLELTGIWFNEVKTIAFEIFQTAKGRVGRYPPPSLGGCSHPFIIMDSNPPVAHPDVWLYRLMELETPDDMGVFIQPGGLSDEAENLENLMQPAGFESLTIEERRAYGRKYYEQMCVGASEEFVRVNVNGEYGTAMGGRSVYGHCFRVKLHRADRTLMANPLMPLVVGIDFGLTPAAALMQMQPDGRVYLLAEVVSEGMGLERFIDSRLRPMLIQHFRHVRDVVIIGDPAGSSRAQTDEATCFDILAKAGFYAYPARTNSPIERIGAVERMLSTLVEGEAQLQVDPGCKRALEGFMMGYKYKERIEQGEYGQAPDKNRHSHLQDAIQYAVMHIEDSGAQWLRGDEEEELEYVVGEPSSITGY